MTAILESGWAAAWHMGLRASLLAAAVWLIQAALSRKLPAQVFHWLWILVALRFLCPLAPTAGWGAMQLIPQASAWLSEHQQPLWRWQVGGTSKSLTSPGRSMETNGTAGAGQLNPRYNIPNVWVLVWIAGMLVQGLTLWLAWLRLRHRWRDACSIRSGRLCQILEEVRSDLKMRRPITLKASTEIPTPMVVGLWRPCIVVPSRLVTELHDEAWRSVLCHECLHLRRWDLAVAWLFTAVRVVHWFNPVAWLAERGARQQMELACDEAVLRLGADPATYGETLLRLAAGTGARTAGVPVMSMAGTKAVLRRRLVAIGGYSPFGKPQWGGAVALFAAVVLAFGANEGAEPAIAPRYEFGPSQLVQDSKSLKHQARVRIAAKFLELRDQTLAEVMLEWGVFSTDEIKSTSSALILEAHQTESFTRSLGRPGIDVVSTPAVTTRTGQTATMEIIREMRYPTAFAEQGGLLQPVHFETTNVGVELTVDSRVNGDGSITLRAIPKTTEFLGFIDRDTGEPVPPSSPSTVTTGPLQRMHTPLPKMPKVLPRSPQPVFQVRKKAAELTLTSGQMGLVSLTATAGTAPFPDPAAGKTLLVLITAERE